MTINAFGLPVIAWSRVARQSCSDCGSRAIDWMMLRDLAWEVPPRDRRRVFELYDFLGCGADAWLCTECNAFGAFGPSEAYLAF